VVIIYPRASFAPVLAGNRVRARTLSEQNPIPRLMPPDFCTQYQELSAKGVKNRASTFNGSSITLHQIPGSGLRFDNNSLKEILKLD